MKKLAFIVLPVLAASLAGCGDTCSSSPADVSQIASCSGSLQANADVTIQVRVCPTCSQTNPSCNTEVVNGQIELNPVFQECQSNASCPASGCEVQPVNCTFVAPSTPGTYPVITKDMSGSVNVASSGVTSCTL